MARNRSADDRLLIQADSGWLRSLGQAAGHQLWQFFWQIHSSQAVSVHFLFVHESCFGAVFQILRLPVSHRKLDYTRGTAYQALLQYHPSHQARLPYRF